MQGQAVMCQWIRATRQGLYDYLGELPEAALTKAVSGFGHGTIEDRLMYNANTYRYWTSLWRGHSPSLPSRRVAPVT
ncbi:MAG: hypothetical protein AB1331_03875 [Bacillota bacterium]